MLFSILIFDEPDTAALRDEYRTRHLDYLKNFDGQTMFAGPFTTDDESADLGSLRLIEFDSREAATKHVEDEPYVIGGVQKRWHIHRWHSALPYTWRDCPRKEGNIQVLFHAIDKPGSSAVRSDNIPAQQAYLDKHNNMVMSCGPLLEDDGKTQIGSVMLIDVPNMHAALDFKDGLPFTKAGLYSDVTLHRWRFGRVFDRFKVPV
jgi:uncharacterized protein YciI